MKTYFILTTAMLIAIAACNDSKNASELARKNVLDSVKSANRTNEVKQETIDSMNKVNASSQHHSSKQPTEVQSTNTHETNAQPNTAGTNDQKKKMKNSTKDALIGGGVGVIGGAIVGAATGKDKGKDAVIGGLIGGAVGAGAGYAVGANKDKKATDK